MGRRRSHVEKGEKKKLLYSRDGLIGKHNRGRGNTNEKVRKMGWPGGEIDKVREIGQADRLVALERKAKELVTGVARGKEK